MPGKAASPSKISQPNPKRAPRRSKSNQDGSSCHQCRQAKSLNLVVACTAIREAKGQRCPIKLCDRCLLNRYGERRDDVLSRDDWQCPKCRGICNCSLCRGKEGQQPTGILTHIARENGFASVSDLLNVKSLDNCKKIVEEKENTMPDKELKACSKSKKSKKRERNGLLKLPNGNSDDNACQIEDILEKPKNGLVEKKKSKKQDTNNLLNGVNPNNKEKRKLNMEIVNVEPEIEMPKGISLTNLAGIDLLPEEISEALQFIEFCAAFGEVLNLKKGHAESIIRELARGRRRKCGQYPSALVQIHVQLLSLIQMDVGIKSPSLSPGTGKNSWLQALGDLASESQNLLKELPSDWFDRGAAGYEELNNSQKLILLNFLCDEALCTTELRLFIEKQNDKFTESEKELKSKITATQYKVKELQTKLKASVTQSLLSQNVTEIEAAIDQLKSELAQAKAERLEAKGALSKGNQQCDAVRTVPILLDNKGCIFWRLKGHSEEPDVLLQDFGAWDLVTPHEKWFAYKEEQKEDILKYLSSSSTKRVRAPKSLDPPTTEGSEITPMDSE